MRSSGSISGLDLSEAYFHEAIGPILERQFPALRYSCCLIGPGSEVLGLDDEVSTDHDWGPRALLLLSDEDRRQLGNEIAVTLSQKLPRTFRGYPTSFSDPDPSDNGTRVLQATSAGAVNHGIKVRSIESFFRDYLGFDLGENLTPAQWLAIPQQRLLSITAGRVFHDDLRLNQVRARFSYYPTDVWLYLLASAWRRIEQEEHLMGRAGSIGDELGSAIIAARLVREMMRLSFFMAKQYIPYPKWVGTAFGRLAGAAELATLLSDVIVARAWSERERHFIAALTLLGARFNSLGIIDPLPVAAKRFFGRSYLTVTQGRFSADIREKIQDPELKAMASNLLIGSIDLFSDNTDLLENGRLFRKVASLYQVGGRSTEQS